MARLREIDTQPVHDRVYRRVRDALMTGVFAPGEPVTIRSLAAELGTSTMPVREALRRLVAERALEVLPSRAFAVPRMSREHLRELLRVRTQVEGMAAEDACARIGDDELRALRGLTARMAEAAEDAAANAVYLRLNRDFHFTVYRAAGSDILIAIIESLWLQAGPYLHALLQGEPLPAEQAEKHHEALIRALERGDAPGARAALVADLTQTADDLIEIALARRHAGRASTG